MDGSDEPALEETDIDECTVTVYNYGELDEEEKNILDNYFGEYRKANLRRSERGDVLQVAIANEENRQVLQSEFDVDDVFEVLRELES